MPRQLCLDKRLSAAVNMLPPCDCVADIGCDHGRSSVALLQQRRCNRVIATDISAPSLKKAQRLCSVTGLLDRVSLRLGDGFECIAPDEAQAALILGMGGELIAAMLQRGQSVAQGLSAIVMQPMRGQEELRRWLYENCYHITKDRVIEDGRRFYQVFCAKKEQIRQPLPVGWDESCFEIGFLPCVEGDEPCQRFIEQRIAQYNAQLMGAKGSPGESKLNARLQALQSALLIIRRQI